MNSDFNGGLVLALATNSAAYLGHTSMASLDAYTTDPQRTVSRSDGTSARLPDPHALENAVDAGLLQGPRAPSTLRRIWWGIRRKSITPSP